MPNDFGVEDRGFREALNNALKSRDTKTVFFLDILGANAWANPMFHSYLYKQIPVYIKRNYCCIWNLEIQDDLIRKKIEERISQFVDVDDVMPDYNSGGPADLHIVRILSWSDEDMRSPVAQDLIDFHSAFNIPLFYIHPRYLNVLLGDRHVEFHLALDKEGNRIKNGCWVYDDERGTRKPYDERIHNLGLRPETIIQRILEHSECIFALEKRRKLLGEETGTKRRVLAVNSPTRDKGGFRGSPTSLLYAIGPLIEEIKAKKINIAGFSHLNIFDPTHYSTEVRTQFREKLNRINPDIVMISITSDAFHVAVEMARSVKNWRENAIVILGGPHCDELNFESLDGIDVNNNPLCHSEYSRYFDFAVSGDGEYMLLTLVRTIVDGMHRLGNGRRLNVTAVKNWVRRNANAFGRVKGYAKLYFNVNGRMEVIRSSMRNPIDLNDLPPLRYEYLKKAHLEDFSIFRDEKGRIKKCVQVMTHRGCSGHCNFCSEKVTLNMSKTVDTVINEIRHYVDKLGVEAVFFDDSTFVENPEYVKKLCDKMLASGLSEKIKWGCLNRFDRIKRYPELITNMSKAGCNYMYLGLELFDDDSLKLMNKGETTTSQEIMDALEILKENNIRVGVSILFGYPGASEEIEKRTIQFVGEMVEKNKIHLVSLSLFNYHLSSTLTETHRRRLANLNYLDAQKIDRQNTAPWNCFEEGGWFHDDSRGIDEEYLVRLLWEVDKFIKNKDVLVRKEEIERFINSLWYKSLSEEPRCFDIITDELENPVKLLKHSVQGLEHYVRFKPDLCNKLGEVYQRIMNNLKSNNTQNNFWLLWGPPGSGKTSFITQIGKKAESEKIGFKYFKLDDYTMTTEIFRSDLQALEETDVCTLCFIDEIQAKPQENYYEIIKSFLDHISERNLPFTVVLAGSFGTNIDDFQRYIESQHFGRDILSRIPVTNRFAIPEMDIGDRIIIAISGIRRASQSMKREIIAVEKLALHWIALNPMLRNDARQIINFVAQAVGRVPPEDKILKYDHLFDKYDEETKKRFKDSCKHHLQRLEMSFLSISN
ncbi:MAG: radical SAM protein [Fervidobacterium sp.]